MIDLAPGMLVFLCSGVAESAFCKLLQKSATACKQSLIVVRMSLTAAMAAAEVQRPDAPCMSANYQQRLCIKGRILHPPVLKLCCVLCSLLPTVTFHTATAAVL